MPDIICLEGIDGCGKSTQIELLKNMEGVSYCWLRWKPFLLRPFYYLLKKKNKKDIGDGIDSNSEIYNTNKQKKDKLFRHDVIRWIWYNVSLIDYTLVTKVKIARANKRGIQTLVFDRYFYDFVIDQGINFRWKLQEFITEIVKLSKLFKKPQLVILLHILPEEALKRKNDIPNITYLNDRYSIYKGIAEKFNWFVIDASLKKEEISSAIVNKMRGLNE